MAEPAKSYPPEQAERAALEQLEQAAAAVAAAPTPRVVERVQALHDRARQLKAWAEFRDWASQGQAPLTAEELEAAEREWLG